MTDDEAYDRMLAYYADLVEQAEAQMRGPHQAAWLSLLDTEASGIRAALNWARENGRHELEILIVSSLLWYWSTRGYQTEARYWLNQILNEREVVSESARSKALMTACYMSSDQGDFAEAERYAGECIELSVRLGDGARMAWSLDRLAYVAWCQGRYAEARSYAEDSLTSWQSIGNRAGVGTVLNILGLIAAYEGDYSSAARLYDRSIAVWREVQDPWGLAMALGNLGEVERRLGKYERAGDCYMQSLSLRLDMADKWSVANNLNNLGELMRSQDIPDRAYTYYRFALTLGEQSGNKVSIATSLAGIAGLAVIGKRWSRAALLMGAAERLLTSSGASLGPANDSDYPLLRDRAASALGDDDFHAKLTQGGMMSDQEAAAYAAANG
jgi:tetratricopeptide (TPR) repeat protein